MYYIFSNPSFFGIHVNSWECNFLCDTPCCWGNDWTSDFSCWLVIPVSPFVQEGVQKFSMELSDFFPKQLTVGVLNATLDLAALVLVGVVGFLGSEVVLSPVVSRCLPLSPVVSLHVAGGCWLVWSASWVLKWSCLPLSPIVSGCLPSCGGWVLVGVVGFLGSEVVLSPVVSGCLPSCGGWVLVGVVGFLGSEVVLSPVVSHCLRLSPFM